MKIEMCSRSASLHCWIGGQFSFPGRLINLWIIVFEFKKKKQSFFIGPLDGYCILLVNVAGSA